MKVVVNLTPNKLVLEGGRYVLPPHERKPLFNNDETAQGVVSAVIRGWARIEDTDEDLAQFMEPKVLKPAVVFEEEPVVTAFGQPEEIHEEPLKEEPVKEGSQGITKFEEEYYDARGELVNKTVEAAISEPATKPKRQAAKKEA